MPSLFSKTNKMNREFILVSIQSVQMETFGKSFKIELRKFDLRLILPKLIMMTRLT